MAVQTCDQITTFRNFDYSRALEIVQDEEYLDNVNFDEIRVSCKQGEVFQAIDNFKERVDNNFDTLSKDFDILREFDNKNSDKTTTTNPNVVGAVRKKRSIFCSDSNTSPPGLLTPPLGSLGAVLAMAAILKVVNPAPGLTPSSSPL